jgi:uncharacterized protein YukE
VNDIVEATPDQFTDTAHQLRATAGTVDDLRDGLPGLPDAGDFTGPAGPVVAHLLDAAAQIADGLGAVGDAVATAGEAYRSTDAAARDQLTNLWTT